MLSNLLSNLSFTSNTTDIKTNSITNDVSSIGSRVRTIGTINDTQNIPNLDNELREADDLNVKKMEYKELVTKVEDKLNNPIISKLIEDTSKSITQGKLNIDPNTLASIKGTMINKISEKLSKPGMPLNQKTTLMKLIRKYCNNSNNINFQTGLRDLLSLLSTNALLELIACISHPEELTNLIKGFLTQELGSELKDNQLANIVTNTLKTGRANVNTLVAISKTDTGKNMIADGLLEANKMYDNIKVPDNIMAKPVDPDSLKNLINVTNTDNQLLKKPSLNAFKINNTYLNSKPKPSTTDLPVMDTNNLLKIKEAFMK